MRKGDKSPLVVILLSTWNGEKYLEEQLQSLYRQNYQGIKILVRDDGSTDKTADLLRKHVEMDRIELEVGENVGFIQSFFWLINNAPKADYYFFADQDDIWLDFKVTRAIGKIEENKVGILPALYFSNYDFYNEKMEFVAHNELRTDVTLALAITEPLAAGFTCAFNHRLLKLMSLVNPTNIISHDHLALVLAKSMGWVIVDDLVTAKYRRHENVASPSGGTFLKKLKWRVAFIKRNRLRLEFREILKVGGCDIPPPSKHILNLLARNNGAVFPSIKLFTYPRRFRTSLFEEVLIRFLFLLNLI